MGLYLRRSEVYISIGIMKMEFEALEVAGHYENAMVFACLFVQLPLGYLEARNDCTISGD